MVVSESGDIITWIRVKDGKLESERVVPIGIMPADIDGPHNVTIAPDNKSYYVSIAHGTPYGSLWRLDASTTRSSAAPRSSSFPPRSR